MLASTPPVETDERPTIARQLATFAVLGVLLIALVVSLSGLGGVLQTVREISVWWVVAALALELASEISFVAVFRLFFDRLSPREGRRLAWTHLGAGVLLPGGGVGGLAIGGWLVHLAGAPTTWIIRRSGGLFAITSAASGATLISSGILLIAGVPGPHDFGRVMLPTMLAAAAILAMVVIARRTSGLEGAPRWFRAIADGVREAERMTFKHPSWRLVGALGYQVFDIAVLWATLRGVGVTTNVLALVLAYTIGHLANALPIPGGVGVLDAGLSAALVLYGVPATQATAAVLVYHAIALWVPGVGGLYAYARVRPRLLKRGYRPRAGTEGAARPTTVGEAATP